MVGEPPSVKVFRNRSNLNSWHSGVVGHFDHPLNRPWVEYTNKLTPLMAEVVGKPPTKISPTKYLLPTVWIHLFRSE